MTHLACQGSIPKTLLSVVIIVVVNRPRQCSTKGGGSISHSKDIHFRVQPEIRKQIELAARESGETISEYCIRVLAAASGYIRPEANFGVNSKIPEGSMKLKDTTATIRLNSQDKEIIQGYAKTAGLSLSEYMLQASKNESVVVIIDGKEILHQLSKIGTNLNQLAILAHQGRITCPDLQATNGNLKKILKELSNIKKGK